MFPFCGFFCGINFFFILPNTVFLDDSQLLKIFLSKFGLTLFFRPCTAGEPQRLVFSLWSKLSLFKEYKFPFKTQYKVYTGYLFTGPAQKVPTMYKKKSLFGLLLKERTFVKFDSFPIIHKVFFSWQFYCDITAIIFIINILSLTRW